MRKTKPRVSNKTSKNKIIPITRLLSSYGDIFISLLSFQDHCMLRIVNIFKFLSDLWCETRKACIQLIHDGVVQARLLACPLPCR